MFFAGRHAQFVVDREIAVPLEVKQQKTKNAIGESFATSLGVDKSKLTVHAPSFF